MVDKPGDIEQVYMRAQAIFESRELARRWMASSVPALQDQKPEELVKTLEGRKSVIAALEKLETGDFS